MATNWTDITNFEQILAIPNQTTGNWFWTSMLYMLFFIMLISMSIFGIEVALLASAFGALIIGLLFVYMGIVSWFWLIPFIGLEIFLFIYILWSSGKTPS